MRTAYREHLDTFSHDLVAMCDLVDAVMTKASDALLHSSLQPAEEALSLEEQVTEIASRCESRAVELLALEGPVARDLRQVVSSIYIVEDFRRMAALAMHIASTARRRHPQAVIPQDREGDFAEFARLAADMAAKTRALLLDPEAPAAVALSKDDDSVDALHQDVMAGLTQGQWSGTVTQAVDATLIGRYYERYADHCVSVADRVIYLSTGMTRSEYLAAQSSRM
ncbi:MULTISPECIES: phosphate signaling complex protein PhoU [unclassified Corynebacterium]|uniref:phosphate signaling complex protein PhoU n=1 Tax=unclassified Corynebacterium TaxID=2624378 RepID=UPI0029CA1FFF|nr:MULTISPECIES: phosphate signaling complex protein PhoU [unclassified Corynebacterium]WPF65748.1 phosphate signaling complex protein PhoU [Corynebacterium sp. 22KM0430]WPF68242.1 phosphate signaling complex protein PhoU [Corynebacterium sp. 21KM1197]